MEQEIKLYLEEENEEEKDLEFSIRQHSENLHYVTINAIDDLEFALTGFKESIKGVDRHLISSSDYNYALSLEVEIHKLKTIVEKKMDETRGLI